MEDKTLRRALLLDFYGDLLTGKQREYLDLYCNDDLSLAEIAEQAGISRQGVWDIIRRAEGVLEKIERKTGFIRKFEERKKAIDDICGGLSPLLGHGDESVRRAAETAIAKLCALED